MEFSSHRLQNSNVIITLNKPENFVYFNSLIPIMEICEDFIGYFQKILPSLIP